ncbi:alpha/beta fold hydrolase [Leptospira kemamanensis]|uniref:Alpha/beta fold hydrolase n=1 Tax=Leptospira kemamanensis TaxID=2484942 RepID=A0A4R9JPQ4_9LEPT|nr:alpha/beta fold hydrolase [Leptospira kemamanensis]TGL50272.1 alpha/beta fold hydrolase [Leptospira kemamanensis]
MNINSTIVRSLNGIYPISMDKKWEFAKANPKWIGHVITQRFLKTQKQNPSRKEMDVLDKSTKSMLHVNQYKIQTYIWNDKESSRETILLVHGWNGHVGNFSRIIPSLIEEGYRVIGLDLPGHGFSSGRYSNIVLSAHIVKAVTEHLGNPDKIITHSFGGAVASVAQELGVSAKKLVYIAPPSKLEHLIRDFSQYLQLSDEEVLCMRTVLEKKVNRTMASIDLEVIGPKLENQLLVIHDRGDLEIPHSMGEMVSQAWKQGKLITTEGLGHKMILRSDFVRDEILRFLS